MTFTSIALGIVTGLALASIYILVALGFTLVIAASGVFNFAQGTLVMIGTVLAFVLVHALGWHWVVAALATVSAGALLGLVTHTVAVRPALGRAHAFTHTTLLTTIGFATALGAATALVFGGDSQLVKSYVGDAPVHFASIPVRPIYLLVIASAAGVTLAIEWVLRNTAAGTVFRMTLEDPEGARLLGIDTGRVILATFALAGALSTLTGFLAAPVVSASAFNAHDLAFLGFAGMAIGGFGSFMGALVGSVVVGLIAGIAPVLADPHLVVPLVWCIVLCVLLVKPSGLWGAAGLFGAPRARDV